MEKKKKKKKKDHLPKKTIASTTRVPRALHEPAISSRQTTILSLSLSLFLCAFSLWDSEWSCMKMLYKSLKWVSEIGFG